MPGFTEANKKELKAKLDYINLDLNNIPNHISNFIDVDFKASKAYDEKTYKVYKYLDVRDIQIVLTTTDRLSNAKEKYASSSPLYRYLIPDTEENIQKHASFLYMLNNVSKEEIEHLDELQKKLNKTEPFGVKFYENYIWQIYYSQYTDTYFMMFPIGETEYASLFYLIKKQIEAYKTNKEELIYVPIRYIDYTEEFLRKSEITDLENYLWLFTRNWPSIYETYDKKGNHFIQIVGKFHAYEKIESEYKLKFNKKEDIVKFYKLTKALFILQTSIPHIYGFNIKVTNDGSIEYYFKNKKINYDNLAEFVHKEYIRIEKEIKKIDKDTKELERKSEDLKILSVTKDLEYIQKERQIATYLECKKTFFGKVKYFVKYKKTKAPKKEIAIKELEEDNKKEEENKNIDIVFTPKEYYTIEDLVVISQKYNLSSNKYKNMNLDIKSLEFKIKNIEKKIENASIYISEIDKHKKSIFEFWKFASKDEMPQLNEGRLEEGHKKKLEKAFDYEDDIEELGEQTDKFQRNVLSKEECDAIYIMNTCALKAINLIKKEELEKEDKKQIEECLKALLDEAMENKSLFKLEQFDIFGSIESDRTKIKFLGSKKHRENEKDKFKILEINKETTINDFIKTIEELSKVIDIAYGKIKALYHMNVYLALSDKEDISLDDYKICNINPYNSIKRYNDNEKIYLYKFNILENMPIIYFTNILYFDNYNKTLPLGMDISDKILLNLNRFEVKEASKKDFKVIQYVDEKELIDTSIKTIKVYDYELITKDEKKEKEKKGNENK